MPRPALPKSRRDTLGGMPFANKAFVEDEKISNYLLSTKHPQGKSKAAIFRKFGFSIDNIVELQNEILKMHKNFDIAEQIDSPHGVKYIIDGHIETPMGIKLNFRTIWIIDYINGTFAFNVPLI